MRRRCRIGRPKPRTGRLRAAMQWYAQMGRRVWPYEIRRFLQDKRTGLGPTVEELWGEPQVREARALQQVARPR